jgi:release factor glutamine methyltransferase
LSRTREAPSWADLQRLAEERLADRREARWMIEEVSGEPLGRSAGRPSEKARLRLERMIERRAAGEPLQYVLGSWSFRKLDLMVDRRVLIPRPETEQVVEHALKEIDALGRSRPDGARLTVVDLGTGSGAIALAVAQERHGVEVWAVDRSPEALDVARANLAGLAGFAATRVRVVQGDWWEGLPSELMGRVDIVVSNPPYISTTEMATLDQAVAAWEPRTALEAGPEGTEDVRRILAGAPTWLAPDGVAVVEIAPHQGDPTVAAALAAGFAEAELRPDLAGRPRALVARRRGGGA